MSDHHPQDDGLRDVEEAADRVARDALDARDENERAMHRGQETDYRFRLPPDMAEADRIRARDDVELDERQAQIAESQRRAAETLRENAERLEGTARALDAAQEAVHDNRGDLDEVRQNQQELRAQVSQAREQVEGTEVPRVDDGNTHGGGRAEGDKGGNG